MAGGAETCVACWRCVRVRVRKRAAPRRAAPRRIALLLTAQSPALFSLPASSLHSLLLRGLGRCGPGRHGLWLALWLLACAATPALCDWAAAREALAAGVERRAFPAAAAAAGRLCQGACASTTRTAFAGAYVYPGDADPPHSAGALQPDSSTLFDMASLTKVLATTHVVALLHQNGVLALDTRVADVLPGFGAKGKQGVTVKDCLLHEAGFAPDPEPNFWEAAFGCAGAPLPVDPFDQSCVSRAYQALLNAPLASAPAQGRAVYSDLSFLTLAWVAGKVAAEKGLVAPSQGALPGCASAATDSPVALLCAFEAAVRRAHAAAGTSTATGFSPSADLWPRAVPTRPPRQEGLPTDLTIQGRVNDGNSAMLGGVAGHAGLFASLDDVLALVKAWTPTTAASAARGIAGDPREVYAAAHVALGGRPRFESDVPSGDFDWTLSAQTAALFTQRVRPGDANSSRALGWDTNSPTDGDRGFNASCSDAFGPRTFMHIGYTGTMLCVDPDAGVYAALLTNRVYPEDEDGSEERWHAATQAFAKAAHNALARNGTRLRRQASSGGLRGIAQFPAK